MVGRHKPGHECVRKDALSARCESVPDEQKRNLDRLLARDLASRQSAYNRIKRHAKRPSRQHLDLLIDQVTWLDELGDFTTAIAGIPASKLRSLANQAMRSYVSGHLRSN